MPELSGIRVLVTGDDEADLAAVRAGLPGTIEVAEGLTAAIAAMRLKEFGALVADVASAQDALALLRAARRARPVTRGIVLMPADQEPRTAGWELVEQAAFTVMRHPVVPVDLVTRVDAAREAYAAERDGAVRLLQEDPLDAEATRWLLAERRLAAVLRSSVQRWSTRSQVGVEDAVMRGVQAASQATRDANGSPEVLIALAAALSEANGVKGEAA
ncbi:MAG: hypothetical protein AB7F65_07125 [Dehalococcoidia bacterium]